LFPISRGIEQVDDRFNGAKIVQSLPQSWSETSALSDEIVFEPDNGDTMGPIGIVIALERDLVEDNNPDKATQRIIVTGDSDFMSNSYIGAGANLSLGMNIINWLAGDDDLIAVEQKQAPDTRLELDDTEIMLIGTGFFIILPAALILSGVVIWMRRRRR
jgi:hypothetical protein